MSCSRLKKRAGLAVIGKIKKMKIDLIIFDFDGTLINSEPVIVGSVNQMLSELKLPQKPGAEIVSYIGRGVKDLVERTLGEENKKLFGRAYKLYWRDISRRNVEEGELYPHVREALEYFKGKKMAVMSNNLEEAVSAVLKKHGIDSYFAAVFGGSDETCLKPLPCPLDKIIEQFGAARDKCAMVGDMDIDIEAGRAAGIRTIAVTYGIGKKEDIIKAQPDYVIEDILQLKDIIG